MPEDRSEPLIDSDDDDLGDCPDCGGFDIYTADPYCPTCHGRGPSE